MDHQEEVVVQGRMLVAMTVLLTAFGSAASGQEAKDKKKDEPPRIMMISPLATTPGEKLTVRLRGSALDTAKEIKFPSFKSQPKVEIKSKGKAEPPKPFDAKVFGDSLVEAEVTIPEDAAAGELPIVIVTEKGQTEPKPITILPAGQMIGENEPNGGFREARPIEPGKTIRGAIAADADVDVFKITGSAGEKWIAEVVANAAGSPLDPLLTLYDAGGRIIAQIDDSGSSRDPKMAFTLPAGGFVNIALTDASDRGSAMHVYKLVVRRAE
jgi:hypothetical protein